MAWTFSYSESEAGFDSDSEDTEEVFLKLSISDMINLCQDLMEKY